MGRREKGIFNHLIGIFKVIKENYNFEIRHKNRKCQKEFVKEGHMTSLPQN